jgi:hypothetical protein
MDDTLVMLCGVGLVVLTVLNVWMFVNGMRFQRSENRRVTYERRVWSEKAKDRGATLHNSQND